MKPPAPTTVPVSVIIPCYNSNTTLPYVLDSIVAQTVKPAEVIIIDDGSKDNPGALAEDYRAKLAPAELVTVRKVNGGISSARNRGIALARQPFIAFLDSDDCWLPTKLEQQIRVFEQDDVVLSSTDFYVVTNLDAPRKRVSHVKCHAAQALTERDVDGLYVRNYIGTSTVMVRTEVLKMAGGFDESLAVMEDYDLWQRLARVGRIEVLGEPLLEYLDRPGSLTKKAGKMWVASVRLAWRHRPGMVRFGKQAAHSTLRTLLNMVKRGPLVGGKPLDTAA